MKKKKKRNQLRVKNPKPDHPQELALLVPEKCDVNCEKDLLRDVQLHILSPTKN